VSTTANAFGRVDDDNNVFVIDDGQERKVGQYPGVSGSEALAYFERKFADLEANVRILEQRVKNKVDIVSISKAAKKLTEDLKEPQAVGDLADLRKRVESITPNLDAMQQEKAAANKVAIAAALKQREEIAAKATILADKDPKKVQWKVASVEMNDLFDKWQQAQKGGTKVPKKEGDAIWKQFSSARTKFETNKRAFFASMTAETKQVRAKKTELVEKVESLAEKGSDSVAEYRKLLDEWKLSGRSSGKQDDSLWDRFKAAGDKIYSVKKDSFEKEKVEYQANLDEKLSILKDAESIDPSKNLGEAKKQLAVIQQRWEKAGKVPKEKIKVTEDKLKAIEQKVKSAEQEQWRKSDPATIERTNGMLSQLEDSIKKLEAELVSAAASKDASRIDEATKALEARKSWLEVVKLSAK
jgi:hypothetical protein